MNTHIYQQMHTIDMKSHIIRIHELSIMFQQKISIFREILIQKNVKLLHPSYIWEFKINCASYKYKNDDAVILQFWHFIE